MMHIKENWRRILDIHIVLCIDRKDSPFQLQCLWCSSLVFSRENPYPTTLETTDCDQCNLTVFLPVKMDNICIYFTYRTYLPSLRWSLWEFRPRCIQRQSLFVCLCRTVQWTLKHWGGPDSASPSPVQEEMCSNTLWGSHGSPCWG